MEQELEQLRQDNTHLRERVSELEKRLRRFGNLSKFPLWNHKQFQYKVDKISEWVEEARKRGSVDGETFEVLFLETFGMTFDYWIGERNFHLAFYQREGAACDESISR
jgi:hypothetical protein